MPFRVICDTCGKAMTQEEWDNLGLSLTTKEDEPLTFCDWSCLGSFVQFILGTDFNEEPEQDEPEEEPEEEPQLVMPPPRSARMMPVSPKLDHNRADYDGVVIQNMRVDGRPVS